MRWTQTRFAGGARFTARCLPLLLAAACAGSAPDAPDAETARTAATVAAASAEPEHNPLRNAYFGDVHVHTNWSLDAYVLGGNRDDPVPEWGGSAVEMGNRPERLWEWLETACRGDCQVVSIPHNSNLSGGLSFADSGWAPHTPEMLRLRAWAEPLVEIHQIKGSSECYRGLGAAELSTTWTDPDFDPALRAFYYVRALENPTCRWTTHRALARGVEPPPSDPPTVKERAWSSPIWYTPAGP